MVQKRQNFWLMKSEPFVYGIDDLARDGVGEWNGIRNYQVRNLIRDELHVGDLALFYHSSAKEIGCAGIMEVVGEPYADPTQFDPKSPYFDPKATPATPRWLAFAVKHAERFSRVVTLEEMRSVPQLTTMRIMERGNRLSITSVTKQQFNVIVKLAHRQRVR
jgi:predicted RNA-binding protein with PUA-like domain